MTEVLAASRSRTAAGRPGSGCWRPPSSAWPRSGWSGSTVAVVAERAGVSRGAAQHHFPTREDLVTSAVEYVAAERLGVLRAHARRPADRPGPHPRPWSPWSSGCTPARCSARRIHLWVAASSDERLRERVVALEAQVGRETHRTALELLGVDESRAGRARGRAGHPRHGPRPGAGEPAHRRQRRRQRGCCASGRSMLSAVLRQGRPRLMITSGSSRSVWTGRCRSAGRPPS